MSNQRSAGIVSAARESSRSHSNIQSPIDHNEGQFLRRPVNFETVKFSKQYLNSVGLVHAAWEHRNLEILQSVK
jgi:hypothetical protein